MREPKLYLLGIARRKIAEHHRTSRRQRGPGTLAIEAAHLLSTQPPDTEQAVAVRQVLSKLPELYREVLVLKYVLGLSVEEVARVIGKNGRATRSVVQRAREAFTKDGAHLIEDGRA